MGASKQDTFNLNTGFKQAQFRSHPFTQPERPAHRWVTASGWMGRHFADPSRQLKIGGFRADRAAQPEAGGATDR
jgi:hypothetical protein